MPNAPGSPGSPPDRSAKPRQPSRPSRNGAAASSDSSTGSRAGSRFLADPGPAFDAKKAKTAPPPAAGGATLHEIPGGLAPLDMWEEDRVRQLLTAQGALLHAVVGVHRVAPGLGEYDDWRYTEDDLAAIAPPLTNILNRYDVTRAAAAAGDEAAVAVGFGGYVIRSYMTRRAVLAQLAEIEPRPEPVSGLRPENAAPRPPAPEPEPLDVDPGGLSWNT